MRMTVAALDLTTIPPGVYRVERRQRVVNLQVEHVEHGRWAGWSFVSELDYMRRPKGLGAQSPGKLYRGPHLEDFRAIRLRPGFYKLRYASWLHSRGFLDDRLHDRPTASI